MTHGELFKQKRGYSKTTKRLLNKNNLKQTPEGLAELKEIRRKRRKAQKILRRKKHQEALVVRRASKHVRKSKHKGRTKGNGGRGGVQKKSKTE